MSAGALAICFLAAGWTAAVRAEDAATVRLSLKDHRFQPAEAHAPAGKHNRSDRMAIGCNSRIPG